MEIDKSKNDMKKYLSIKDDSLGEEKLVSSVLLNKIVSKQID